MVVMSIEWKAPLCSTKGTRRSMSGRMETRNNKGIFTFTLNSFEVALADKYPRAKCPTAYVAHHSQWLWLVVESGFVSIGTSLPL